ncbi:MAG: adaptor protein MecA [Agathobacter sp.]|nr:adaptor protein MecA [Agathobacter sp.]
MKFSRIGEHTIKCVISEEEIYDLGFTMEEIMSNGERTQEFMNQIFDMAEQEFEMKFDFGVKTVRADFLSNHTLSLTFSEHPVSEGMMEHLKDIVNDLISEHGQKIRESQKKENKDVSSDVVVLFELENFDDLISFVKNIKLECRADTTLYKDNDKYYLAMDLSGAKEDEIKRMSVTADEYVNDIMAGVQRKAYFDEHADVIIKEKALEKLRML